MGRVAKTRGRAPQASGRGKAKSKQQVNEERQLSLLAQRLAPVDLDRPKAHPSPRGAATGKRPTRRKAPRGRRRMLARRAAAATCFLLTAAATAWVWHSGWAEQSATAVRGWFYETSARAGLSVQDVLAEGRERTSKSDILAALEVRRGSPILAVSPADAKARLEALPWVRRAIVERRFPDTFFVSLEERHPIALWQRDGALTVIDQAGDPIPGASLSEFASLPIVVGEDAPRHALELLTMLQDQPDLGSRVTAAVRVSGRRWNVRLDDGIDVHLPMNDPAAAWAKLAVMNRRHAVLGRDVMTIDLRLPDRMVVRMAPGATVNDDPGKDP
jgi:cell division protein FtsQ